MTLSNLSKAGKQKQYIIAIAIMNLISSPDPPQLQDYIQPNFEKVDSDSHILEEEGQERGEAMLGEVEEKNERAFRFINYIADKPEFIPIVKEEWKLKEKLKETQAKIDKDPFNSKIREEFAIILQDYKEAMDDEYKLPLDEDDQMFIKKLDVVEALNMIKDITDKEIKEAVFDIDNDKAPGPDGYTSCSFKKAWNVVGMDVCLAVKEFFQTGKLLKEMKATIISLIPKLDTPNKVSDFRPIACFNVLYKCISKVLTNKIKSGLEKEKWPKCGLKIDLQKAHDTMSWSFLKTIMESVNGQIHGYFKGAKGLRQNDHISSYLFILVMEVLNLIMIKNIKADRRFKYHAWCKDLQLTHICFTDDLMIFCNRDVQSIYVVKKSLNDFSKVSGLFPNLKKSTIFFGSINDQDHNVPLSNFITKIDIYDARFKSNNSVAKLIEEDRWKWPSEWLDMFPVLKEIQVPSLNDSSDKTAWISKTVQQKDFSVKVAWNSVRTEYPKEKKEVFIRILMELFGGFREADDEQ
nr:hypothetical protein [Tanacetum cinerariifolium]